MEIRAGTTRWQCFVECAEGTYFSIRLPEGVLRSLKSTQAVCEFGVGGLSDEHEVGISGVTPDIRAAPTLAGAAALSGRGKQLVFLAVLDSNIA